MKNEEFEALVTKLEKYAQQNPKIYKLSLGLLATLGYAYIFLILAGLLAVLAGLVIILIYSKKINFYMIKFGIILIIPVLIILRSLWVQIPPPTGLNLSRKQVPTLFLLLDDLSKSLQAPKFHHILLTSEYNASVVQIPRLGLFGWQQNYLIIGLPLMQALSPEQFRAVLAHELGHLSGNHSRFAGWIYRVRKTWGQMLEGLQNSEQSGAVILFSGFFNWYAPFFSAYSFVLARADEYEADRCAAELAGNQHIAEALINLEIKHRFLEESFWTKIYKLAQEQPNPPKLIFTTLARAIQTELKPEKAQLWMEQALAVKTDSTNTHPCLSDRLKALKYNLTQPPEPVQQTAEQFFLDRSAKSLALELEGEWQTAVNYQWHERYNYAQNLRHKLQGLEKKAAAESLTVDEAWMRAKLTFEIAEATQTIPLVKSVLQMQPDHSLANYLLGQILLEQEDAKGIEYLEKGMAKDPEIVLPGCELIYSFFQNQGRKEEATRYHQRAQQHYEQLVLGNLERSEVSASDRFEGHGLSAAAESELSKQLARYHDIKAAYLVKKVVKHFPEKPFYILAVKRKWSFWETGEQNKDKELLNELATQLNLPDRTWLIPLDSSNKALETAFRKTPSGLIYSI